MLKENNGKLSYTRVTGFIIVVCYLIWASFIVFKTSVIPDIPVGVLTLLLGLYGINKFSNALGKNKEVNNG